MRKGTIVDGMTGVNTVKLACHLRDSEHGTPDPLRAVLFHVANFDQCIGSAIGNEKRFQHGRTSLEADGWKVTIDNVDNIQQLVEELGYSRGGAITHAGRLERFDRGEFSAESAKDVLWALSHLLSFAMGHQVSIVLPVGLDGGGQPVWHRWNTPKSCHWTGGWTWFNNQHPQALQPLFEGLLTQWQDTDVREAHQLALYWYLLAVEETYPDAALVIAFTCLELIAFFWLVEKETIYKAKEFDDQPAKEKLRRLLKRIGVPEAIPPELGELNAHATTKGWGDGPEAVASLRNAAVHPKRRAAIFAAPERARDQALYLALWYIELSLLHFLGFNDKYVNRLKRKTGGFVEKVPWAT